MNEFDYFGGKAVWVTTTDTPVKYPDPPPTVTFSAEDVGAIAAIEAYRTWCYSRNYSPQALEMTELRERFVRWQLRNPDLVRRSTPNTT